jgi:hypothetical protein
LVAAAGLAFGAFWAGMPPSPPITELLSLAVFGVLIAAGVRRQSLVYVGFGVVTGFQALLKLVLRHVDDPTLAGLALIGLGLLLLLAIAGLRSSKLWGRWSTTDRDGGMWSTTPTNEQDVTLTT